MIEPMLVGLAFIAGLVFKRLGMPPLLGYLVAGFLAGGLQLGDPEVIHALSELGIILLLFTIGLKLNIRELFAPQIWATASLHTVVVVPLTALMLMSLQWVIPHFQPVETSVAWMLAFALSFSSTVFAVKIFDERGEGAALHAKIAIGILIVQDIFAVCFLVFSAEQQPSQWAIALLAIPLLRPILAASTAKRRRSFQQPSDRS